MGLPWPPIKSSGAFLPGPSRATVNGQLWKAGAHHPADTAPDTWGHHHLPLKGKITGSSLSSMRKLSLFIPSDRWSHCQAGATAPVCPAPSFSFLCFSGSAKLGPGRLQQGLLLRKIAQNHNLKKGQLKQLSAFSLSDWQLGAGKESCAMIQHPRGTSQRN